MAHRPRRWALAATLSGLAALAVAAPGAAHTELLANDPESGAVVAASPRQVRLEFSEPVQTAFGAVRVYDGQARRIDRGPLERPLGTDVVAAVPDSLARGTYTVVWRVVSEDGHPLSGDFVASVLSSVSVLLALVAPIAMLLQGASAGGTGFGEAATWDVLSTVAGTRFGHARLAEVGIACTCAVLLWLAARRGPDSMTPAAAAGFACLLVFVPSSAGHASVSGGVAFVADSAHVAAAAVWVGGLAAVMLALLTAGSARWPLAGRVVPRFSALAAAAVAVLVVAGTANAYFQVQTVPGLWDTSYGKVLLLKLALALPLLALGAYNNRFAVPRLRAEIASPAERTRFLRTAAVELTLMAAVVVVTGVLVGEPPARAQAAQSITSSLPGRGLA